MRSGLAFNASPSWFLTTVLKRSRPAPVRIGAVSSVKRSRREPSTPAVRGCVGGSYLTSTYTADVLDGDPDGKVVIGGPWTPKVVPAAENEDTVVSVDIVSVDTVSVDVVSVKVAVVLVVVHGL